MIYQDVVSSNINRIGWDDGTLYLTFKSGETYSYDEAPLEVYHQMVAAESVGKYFHKSISGVFNHTKLGYDPFPMRMIPETALYYPLRQGEAL